MGVQAQLWMAPPHVSRLQLQAVSTRNLVAGRCKDLNSSWWCCPAWVVSGILSTEGSQKHLLSACTWILCSKVACLTADGGRCRASVTEA